MSEDITKRNDNKDIINIFIMIEANRLISVLKQITDNYYIPYRKGGIV